MNRSDALSREEGVSTLLRSPWWSRSAILCVAVMGLAVVLLQIRQAERSEERFNRWRELREARLDLARGFLHAMEAGHADQPYSRAQGRQLLRQGVTRLQAELKASDPVAGKAFDGTVRRFDERFEWWERDPNPGSSAELRAAFTLLEREAERIDERLQAELHQLTARHRREFLVAIGVALVLLGLLCAVLLRVQRARAMAERELAARESRLRRMTEGLPQLIWTWQPDGGCDYVNRRWTDYTGADPASQLGDGWLANIYPADRAVFQRTARQAVERGEGFELQLRLRGADGSHRWFSTRVLPLEKTDGGVGRWLGSCTDIQRDRELREAAEAERNFSDALIDSLPGVFYLYDTTGKFLRWNKNFERVTGFTGAEIARMHPLDFFVGEDRARVEERIAQVFAVGKSEVEAGFTAKDGATTPYFFTGLTTDIADATCLIGVGVDITLRKAAEDEVRALNDTLEHRVAERTAELQAKNRELETFTYSVSHDLKAPLRGIDGYSRLLLEDYADRLDDEGRRFLESVRQASVQMGQLIDDLLSYSRLERRAMTLAPVNLSTVLDGLPIGYADEIRDRGVDFRAELPAAQVMADPEGLTIVLRNLIDNALKFTRSSASPAVSVGGRVEAGRAVIWVRDNGIGFDMKFIDRIFDIFQRLHRAEDYPGTGIGLAIVRKAMERMHGRAWAESKPGQGATFYLELPLQS